MKQDTFNIENTTNIASDKFYRRVIWIVSVLIFAAILILSRIPKADYIPEWVSVLPKMNAILNGTTFFVLLISFYFIRRKQILKHRAMNLTAASLSTIFLLSYVTFHSFGVETKFPADNPLRSLYLFILITHIILAAAVLPLVLLSLYRGLTMQIDRHKKIARWSYPIWLYVTLTGVIVYLMISPYYKF
jgi:putative membrane protein